MVSGGLRPSGFAVLARADEDKLGADRIAGQTLISRADVTGEANEPAFRRLFLSADQMAADRPARQRTSRQPVIRRLIRSLNLCKAGAE